MPLVAQPREFIRSRFSPGTPNGQFGGWFCPFLKEEGEIANRPESKPGKNDHGPLNLFLSDIRGGRDRRTFLHNKGGLGGWLLHGDTSTKWANYPQATYAAG